MSKQLVCHTSKQPFFTKGKMYEIKDEDGFWYYITADDNSTHRLSKELDYDGLSYKSFMND
jgi:hypothetical protein